MISVMDSLHHRPLDQVDKCLDSQLWHACAGGMVQMPPVNSKVFYFPQGHCEQALGRVDFDSFSSVPAMVLCRVSAVVFMADSETDEVYAKLRLVPVMGIECEFEDDNGALGICKSEDQEKPSSFAKTLTQSDANNGGGFSVPRYCAETIFPRLDYSAEPPVQTILAKDVHGQVWKFRHIYRGTPRRHLLTTGWSNFVNQKKLVAGDSIVFLRADNGDLCVGIRRAKRGFGGGTELTSGWNTAAGNCGSVYGGFSGFMREDENKYGRNGDNVNGCFSGHLNGVGKVSVKSVYEAAIAAAYGQPFEIVYYPRASTPEFCVKAASVRAAMRTQWYSGMRFKMAFETEDSSRISWFMGTISSVQVEDPIRWPNSTWRLLQVAWDEPDLHQNVKRVNPWLVELVSNMPAIHLSPFSPPRKKLRVPHPPDFPHMGQLSMPSLPSNSLSPSNPCGCISDNIPAGIQGARHAQYGLPTPDLHFNKLQLSLFPFGFQQLNHTAAPPSRISSNWFIDNPKIEDNVSCLLTMGNSSPSLKKTNGTKTPMFLLFGQPILTEQQLSHSSSGDNSRSSSLDGNSEKLPNLSDGSGSAILQNGPPDSSSDEGYESKETGHCKVLMESDDVGRTLDLFSLGSYEDLYGKLAMFARCERSSPAINF